MRINGALAVTLLTVLAGLIGAVLLVLNPVPFSEAEGPAAHSTNETPLLRMVGSNTIGGTLAPALAKAYLEQRLKAVGVAIGPGSKRHEQRIEGLLPGAARRQRIEVVATGSGFALDALERGNADIGLASRAIAPGRKSPAAGKNKPRGRKVEYVLGLDGIAIIVHPRNPATRLTLKQVGQLFDGTLKNWREVGGRNLPVHRYARNRESGTYHAFLEMVFAAGTRPDRDTRYIVDSGELSAAVANDPNGIGFVGLPYVGAAKALKLAVPDSATAFPATPLAVYREDYPLSRKLYLYTNEIPANPLVTDFVAFALSPAGQALVEEEGFVGRKVKPADARP